MSWSQDCFSGDLKSVTEQSWDPKEPLSSWSSVLSSDALLSWSPHVLPQSVLSFSSVDISPQTTMLIQAGAEVLNSQC